MHTIRDIRARVKASAGRVGRTEREEGVFAPKIMGRVGDLMPCFVRWGEAPKIRACDFLNPRKIKSTKIWKISQKSVSLLLQQIFGL